MKNLICLSIFSFSLILAFPSFAIDLGPAAPYNGFVFGSYTAPSSDVEGRLAAGGNNIIN